MKKLLVFLFSAITATLFALTLSACGDDATDGPPAQNLGGTASAPSETIPDEISPPVTVYYTVTYSADGKTYAIRNVKSGEAAEEIIIPDTATYTFGGWTLNGGKYDFSNPVTGDITLVAEFRKVLRTATFTYDSGILATYEFNEDVSEIEFPEVPQKPHYTGEWRQLPQEDKNLVFIAAYAPTVYEITFLAENGTTVSSVKYTIETAKTAIESNIPPVPSKLHYSGSWGDFTLYEKDETVSPIYAPNEYKLTFAGKNGGTVKEIIYTIETDAKQIEEPPVPELEGYENGRWESYELTYADFTVYPVYDKIPDPPDKFTEGLVFTPNEDGGYTVTDYTGAETEVIIPSAYNNAPVTAIADDTFAGCNITEIHLPDALEIIGKNAFANCTQLKTVAIPDSVHTIKSMAFAGCTSLESVTVGKGVAEIPNMAFAKCSNLQTVICASAQTIPQKNAFYECPKFKVITYTAQTDRQ